MQRRLYLFFIITILIAFFAGNLAYPDFIKRAFPSFPDIPFRLGLDLKGGTHLIYEADLSGVEKDDNSSAMQGLRDVMERRINLFGVAEPVVQTQDAGESHRLVIELAGVKDSAEAIKMIGQTPFLEFKEQRPEEDTQKIIDKIKEFEGKTEEEIKMIDNWEIALEDPYFQSTMLTGKYLKKADLGFDQTIGNPIILLQFNDEGADLFEEITERNIGKMVAMYVDGVRLSSPTVEEKIPGGQARITGSFTVEEAKSLARNLNAGALPVPIRLISQQSVGPTLGAVSLDKSLKAGLIGFLLIVIFMVIFYKVPGILASISMAIYVAILLSLFKLIPVTLTLAGIGGFILSIGMAIDANILIFARMREELKEGKSFSVAIEEGFRRSWPSIRDGNITTLIVALILFWLGTSFIKGFALTLILGILISMFSAIFITRTLIRLFAGTRLEKPVWLWK